MKTRYLLFVILLGLALLLTGCSSASQYGSLSMTLDLSSLTSRSSTRAITITNVSVALSRSGYDTVTKELAVANNQASGRIDGLAPGIWNMAVVVKQDTTQLYSGSTDVAIIPGVVQECQILLDPSDEAPTTGSVSVVVGVNPLPGYKQLNQVVSQVVADGVGSALYIVDGSTNKVGVYNMNTLERGQDLNLPQAPISAILNPDRASIYLGYTTGRVYSLNLTTGESTLVGDAGIAAKHLVAFGSSYLLVSDAGYATTTFKSLNVATKAVVDTVTEYYASCHTLEYDPVDTTAYFHDTGISPADLNRVRLNASTGDIVSLGESIYHGDYALGYPIRIINSGTRVATSSGSMFTCSGTDTQDLIYAGNLGCTYVDLRSDDAAGYLYLINSAKKLVVLNQDSFFIKISVDLLGTPKQVFFSPTHILVLVENAGKYYVKSWSKAGLGL